MGQQFVHLASVSFHHEYSGEERFEGLTVVASAESGRRLGNLSVLLKPFSGGIHILSSDPTLLLGEQEPILLRVVANDPFFFNFTDLGAPFRIGTKVFCFSNFGKNQAVDRLHQGDYVSIDDSLNVLDQPTLRELLPKLASGEVTIRDPMGGEIVPSDYARYLSESGESILYLDDGTTVNRLYNGNLGMDRRPFGILALDLDRIYQSFEKSRTPIAFQIRFSSRKTFWKYILSDRIFDKFTKLSVIDAQNKAVLFREGEFEIQSAGKVRTFESEVELPFSASFHPRFQLIERPEEEGQAGKVVVRQLPKASPAQLYHLPTKNEILYTHIFI